MKRDMKELINKKIANGATLPSIKAKNEAEKSNNNAVQLVDIKRIHAIMTINADFCIRYKIFSLQVINKFLKYYE